jgi:hypothetical protein
MKGKLRGSRTRDGAEAAKLDQSSLTPFSPDFLDLASSRPASELIAKLESMTCSAAHHDPSAPV